VHAYNANLLRQGSPDASTCHAYPPAICVKDLCACNTGFSRVQKHYNTSYGPSGVQFVVGAYLCR
jgi:hypothetical protein